MRTVITRKPKEEATVIRPTPPVPGNTESFAAQLAVFTVAMNKQPGPLLEMLAEELVPAAKDVADHLTQGTSAERQAALSRHFGVRSDAQRRLREVAQESGPVLRAEMARIAPPWMRSWIADLVPAAATSAPAPFVTALAERLIREATR